MKKIVNPCFIDIKQGCVVRHINAYAEITYENGRLSIHGVIGPKPNGNCWGSCGQCQDEIRMGIPAVGWTPEMLIKFCNIWDAWHLNDMRPYCEHQKALGWDELAREKVEICHHSSSAWEPNTFEMIALGWLYPDEHPAGLLTKPCPVCGYKYGTEWKTEPVPQDVIDWLAALPDSKKTPAWI